MRPRSESAPCVRLEPECISQGGDVRSAEVLVLFVVRCAGRIGCASPTGGGGTRRRVPGRVSAGGPASSAMSGRDRGVDEPSGGRADCVPEQVGWVEGGTEYEAGDGTALGELRRDSADLEELDHPAHGQCTCGGSQGCHPWRGDNDKSEEQCGVQRVSAVLGHAPRRHGPETQPHADDHRSGTRCRQTGPYRIGGCGTVRGSGYQGHGVILPDSRRSPRPRLPIPGVASPLHAAAIPESPLSTRNA